ncbi:MAG: hypothetical protein ACP5I6_04170 [Caldisphaera sp.]|nr:hypothetical protein [Caldisphaera sp.]PMP61123.1 MAG: hypothetical protein C0201_00265 [Caldisphaera sp.]
MSNCDFKNSKELLDQSASKLAQLLQEQINLINNGHILFNMLLSVEEKQKEEAMENLKDIIDKLKEIRLLIRKETEFYQKMIVFCNEIKNMDIETLIGYYIQAGSKKEEDFLKSLSGIIDVKDDLVDIKSIILKLKGDKNLIFNK